MTSKQRAYLRSLANTMEPILHIGKEGVTQGVAQQAWDALEARELIKVTVQRNAPYDSAREACCARRRTRNPCSASAPNSSSIAARAGIRTCWTGCQRVNDPRCLRQRQTTNSARQTSAGMR